MGRWNDTEPGMGFRNKPRGSLPSTKHTHPNPDPFKGFHSGLLNLQMYEPMGAFLSQTTTVFIAHGVCVCGGRGVRQLEEKEKSRLARARAITGGGQGVRK